MTVLTFSTKLFDLASAKRPTINPIYGHSLAEMLRQEFIALGHKVDEAVEEEDWGWSFYTEHNKQQYMIGTCAYVDSDPETFEPILTDEPVVHLIQFHKVRTLKDRFLGRNKFTRDDQIILITEEIVKRKVTDMTEFSKDL